CARRKRDRALRLATHMNAARAVAERERTTNRRSPLSTDAETQARRQCVAAVARQLVPKLSCRSDGKDSVPFRNRTTMKENSRSVCNRTGGRRLDKCPLPNRLRRLCRAKICRRRRSHEISTRLRAAEIVLR